MPQSIDEAGQLYRKNMRVSTELWQTWKLREEFMADESGILRAEAAAASAGAATRDEAAKLSRRMSALVINDEEEGDDPMDPLSMLRTLEQKMREEEKADLDTKKQKALAQKRGDVQRLERVEVLYVSVSS